MTINKGSIAEIEKLINENITRLEVIWQERELVRYGKISISIQDNWITLKIFTKT